MAFCSIGNDSIYYERTRSARTSYQQTGHPQTGHESTQTSEPQSALDVEDTLAASDAPTLLFVHGVGGAVETWIAMRSFFRKYDCIYVDLPGHGRSSGSALTVSENAAVLAQLIQRLSVPSVVCVGISYGSSVGLALAVHHTEVIRALVLMSPRTYFHISSDDLAATIESVFDGEFVKQGAGSSTSATMIAGMQRGMRATPAATIIGLFEKYNGYDLRRVISQIEAPTLILSGREDGISNPDDALYLQHTLSDARLIQLDTGHFIPIEAPRDAARAIKEFVSMLK